MMSTALSDKDAVAHLVPLSAISFSKLCSWWRKRNRNPNARIKPTMSEREKAAFSAETQRQERRAATTHEDHEANGQTGQTEQCDASAGRAARPAEAGQARDHERRDNEQQQRQGSRDRYPVDGAMRTNGASHGIDRPGRETTRNDPATQDAHRPDHADPAAIHTGQRRRQRPRAGPMTPSADLDDGQDNCSVRTASPNHIWSKIATTDRIHTRRGAGTGTGTHHHGHATPDPHPTTRRLPNRNRIATANAANHKAVHGIMCGQVG